MHLSLDTYIYGRNTKFLGEESISHGTVPTSKRHNHHIIQCPRSVEPLNCGMSIGLSCAMQKRCCCEEELVRSLTSVQVGAGDCESQWPSERRITCCRPDRSPVCHAATNQLPKLSNYACITQYSASDSLFSGAYFVRRTCLLGIGFVSPLLCRLALISRIDNQQCNHSLPCWCLSSLSYRWCFRVLRSFFVFMNWLINYGNFY